MYLCHGTQSIWQIRIVLSRDLVHLKFLCRIHNIHKVKQITIIFKGEDILDHLALLALMQIFKLLIRRVMCFDK